jgi:hypothetical protein
MRLCDRATSLIDSRDGELAGQTVPRGIANQNIPRDARVSRGPGGGRSEGAEGTRRQTPCNQA